VSPDAKKEIELFYLTQFNEFLPTFPKGKIISGERPDFLIESANETLGIEITRLFRETPPGRKSLQEQESLVAQIVKTARAAFEAKGLPPAWVTIHFDFNFNRSRRDIQPTANAISNLVAVNFPSGDEAVDIRRWTNEDIFPLGIDLISVHRLKRSSGHWHAPHGSFVPKVEPLQIQKILNNKSPRVQIYRKKCDRIWLVMIVDRFTSSMFSLIPEETLEHSYSHQFDSAFLFFYDRTDSQKPPFLLQKS
jgi:hypothetical protein